MRNLKRVLSLALALVMVLGMMVIGTSAATFTDAEEITYTEAVDVMSALGVINGYPAADGTFYFDADAALTREQGAALVCYMLMGKTAADKLVGSGAFSDVATDRWSAGEIDYCYNLGLIKGNPDGTFNPEGPLTAIAFGRMLLGALGYDGDVEGYTGGNWATNIAADMIEAGLVVKDVAMDAQMTREQAAQMALQALEADMVWYPTGKGTDITFSDGTSVNIGAGAAAKVTTGNTLYADGTAGSADASYQQFCEKYFPKLNKEAVAASDNAGLAGYRWFLNADKANAYNYLTDASVGIYTTEAVSASFAGGTKFVDIVKALGVKNSAKQYVVEVYRNDVEVDGVYSVNTQTTFYAGTKTGATLYSNATSFGTVPNGVTIDVVVTATGTIRLLINIEYLGVVSYNGYTKDTNTDDVDDRNVTMAVYVNGAATSPATNYTLTALNCAEFEEIYAAVAALKNPNAKLYYVVKPEGDLDAATGYMLSIVPAASITGKVSSKTGSVYTINGTAYNLSATAAGLDMTGAIYTVPAVYYLDTAGNILFKTATPAAAKNYVFLEDFQAYSKSSTGLADKAGYYMQAKLVKLDGTVEIVDVASIEYVAETVYNLTGIDGTKVGDGSNSTVAYTTVNSNVAGTKLQAYTYTVNENGSYNLVIGNTISTTTGAVSNTAQFITGKVADNTTTFVVRTGAGSPVDPYKYVAYTGYAALPAQGLTAATVYGNSTGNVVYITGTLSAVQGAANLVFITDTTPEYTYVNGSTKDTYVFKAIVGGAATTVTANATTAAVLDNATGMYSVKYTNGVITDISAADGTFTDGDTDAALTGTYVGTAGEKGVVYIGGTAAANAKTYNGSEVVYLINATTKVLTVGTVEDIEAGTSGDTNVFVQYVKNAAGRDTDAIAVIYAVQ